MAVNSFAPIALTGGANGVPIAVAATATPGTVIHTVPSGFTLANAWHKLWVWFNNTDSVPRQISVEWGGGATPALVNRIVVNYTLPPYSRPILLVDGLLLQNALTLRAFASVTNIINASGYALEIA